MSPVMADISVQRILGASVRIVNHVLIVHLILSLTLKAHLLCIDLTLISATQQLQKVFAHIVRANKKL